MLPSQTNPELTPAVPCCPSSHTLKLMTYRGHLRPATGSSCLHLRFRHSEAASRISDARLLVALYLELGWPSALSQMQVSVNLTERTQRPSPTMQDTQSPSVMEETSTGEWGRANRYRVLTGYQMWYQVCTSVLPYDSRDNPKADPGIFFILQV